MELQQVGGILSDLWLLRQITPVFTFEKHVNSTYYNIAAHDINIHVILGQQQIFEKRWNVETYSGNVKA